MTNILFISAYLNRAGTETFMMNVFRHVDHTRFHVDFLIFTQQETDYSREVEKNGSKVWRLRGRRKGILHSFIQLKNFFKQNGSTYHAIHWCGNSLSSMTPLFFAWKYNIPVRIVHAHNSSAAGLHNRLLHCLHRKFVARITTHHLACSSAAAKWFFGNDKNTIIIKNGIDTDKYKFNPIERSAIRKKLGIAANTTVIGHAGRFCVEKNHTYLLDIFNSYLSLNNDAILLLVGKGELENEIKEKAQQLNISSRVMFMGERNDVPQLMQAMDCFVLSSLFEGLPFVLVEAQGAGLPCLVSDIVNIDIAITSNISFESISASPQQWAEKIQEYCISHVRADTGTALSKAGYSVQTSIHILENIYN